MVARKDGAELRGGALRKAAKRLMLSWRIWLTSAIDASRRGLRRVCEVPARQPARGAWFARPWVTWLGILCLLAGAAAGVALAPRGQTQNAAVAAGALSLAWAFVRWLCLQFIGRRAADRHTVTAAWGLGATVYLIGVTPELRLAAWIGSAALTWFGLRRLGDDARDATRSVGIAWGIQGTVVVASWVARNAIIAYLITHG